MPPGLYHLPGHEGRLAASVALLRLGGHDGP